MSAAYLRRCAGKERHESRTDAAGEKSSITGGFQLSKGRVSVYHCDQCLGWHVGGSNSRFRSRRRRSGKRPNKRMRGRV